jgi:hypothetical protein
MGHPFVSCDPVASFCGSHLLRYSYSITGIEKDYLLPPKKTEYSPCSLLNKHKKIPAELITLGRLIVYRPVIAVLQLRSQPAQVLLKYIRRDEFSPSRVGFVNAYLHVLVIWGDLRGDYVRYPHSVLFR